MTLVYGIYILERKHDVWEIRTSPTRPIVQHTNHWATEHVKIVNRLYIQLFYIKTVSVMTYTLHYCENYANVSLDCLTKRDGSSVKSLVLQQNSRNIMAV